MATADPGAGNALPLASKDVNRFLRRIVWPALKEHGFVRRTDRSAWRDGDDQIHLVNFQSITDWDFAFNCTIGCSFAINLGVMPRCHAPQSVASRDGLLRPADYECDFRSRLAPPYWSRVTTTWAVNPDGSDVERVVTAARDTLLASGLEWFARLDGLDAMLAASDAGMTWFDVPNLGSPHQLELSAALEAAIAAR